MSNIFLPKAAMVAALSLAAPCLWAQTITHQWNFSGGSLADSVDSADLTNNGGVVVGNGVATFDGSNALETNANLFDGGPANGIFSAEIIFEVGSVPTGRSPLMGEYDFNTNNNSRGWELYIENGGGIVMEVSNTRFSSGSGFFASTNVGQGGNAGFVVSANTQYRLGFATDFSGLNSDNSDFESGFVTFFLEDLTNGTPVETVSLRVNLRDYAGGAGEFTIGNRDIGLNPGATGWTGDINAVALYDGAITESTLVVIPESNTYSFIGGFFALGLVVLRRRN